MLSIALLLAAAAQPPASLSRDSLPARADSVRADSAAHRGAGRGPQDLGAVRVTAGAGRRRGYAVTTSRTATKTDTPLRDTPQAVTVVTRQLIADQAMQGMADVVRYVPNVTMGQGEGHRDAPTIRGNSTTADFFVDGVRDDAQYIRDLYNVERVEALKGANAMTFGRGGGGGVINRVLKEAGWTPTRALSLEGGSFDHRRATADVGQGVGDRTALRVNGLYERSGSFRDATTFRRFGVNPTATFAAAGGTVVRVSYERFDDARTVDRGIPSFQGAPSPADRETFFGDPATNHGHVHVNGGAASVEQPLGRATLRSRMSVADYDKFYQNVVPGAVTASGAQVSLSGYNHALRRGNAFGQTDLTLPATTGPVAHTLLVGTELGRQTTDQMRNTAYFGTAGTATTFSAAFADPEVTVPIAFKQSATDADNFTTARVASAYAQDQLALTRRLQAIVGLRYDQFGIRFRNDRNGQTLSRLDHLVSPRAGLVAKPVEPLSVYGSYGVSFLPSAGDQFASLTVNSQALEPERFTNREVGAKWDVRPALSLTAAAFRLDRTNTSAPDPTDATKTVQTGAQRTTGYEVGVAGNPASFWQVAGGWGTQRARIVSRTAAAAPGATVPLVPHHTISLWNRVDVAPALGLGLGVVHQADMYAAIDNTVTLPRFTRLDAAAFVRIDPRLRLQLNVENLRDTRYFATSQGNNNILPGAPRTVRLSLSTGR